MPPIVGRVERDDDLVSLAGSDLVVAARTAVRLVGLVGLDVPDFDLVARPVERHRGSAAHNTSNAMTSNAIATSAMSLRRLTGWRNGLKPTPLR
jgi:hypothetical protein